MFQSKPDFLAIGKNQLVEIVKYVLQRLGICLIYLDDLGDTACIEWLVFDVAKIAEDFLDFVVHIKNIKQIIMAEYLSATSKILEKNVYQFYDSFRKAYISTSLFYKLNIFMDI